jgi:hypothetical protein
MRLTFQAHHARCGNCVGCLVIFLLSLPGIVNLRICEKLTW